MDIIRDLKQNNQCKGFGFVTMAEKDEGERAIQALDKVNNIQTCINIVLRDLKQKNFLFGFFLVFFKKFSIFKDNELHFNPEILT